MKYANLCESMLQTLKNPANANCLNLPLYKGKQKTTPGRMPKFCKNTRNAATVQLVQTLMLG